MTVLPVQIANVVYNESTELWYRINTRNLTNMLR